MGVFGFVLPSEVSPGVGMGFAKGLEKFWNLARQNLCKPWICKYQKYSHLWVGGMRLFLF